jgi:hypothetical protein
MTAAHTPPPAVPNQAASWLTALASLAVGAAFLLLRFWLLPPWLSFQLELANISRWRWLGLIPSNLGFAASLKCIWEFG